ncbi:NAD(P)/FAD-dependent oxidoreductase [Micromonospora sp. NPDC048905]|uniref:phytoene desaturase family protein n=1 Tax=unclassified Micromonospora TaxID=2617518 RepID=UPI0033E4DFD5
MRLDRPHPHPRYAEQRVRLMFDVVVIGSGLGGLSAGALLARAGLRVAVVERNAAPGGYAQPFRRGPHLFDPAIHFTLDAGPAGFIPGVLDHLNVADRVEFRELPQTYQARFPSLTVDAPPGRLAFLELHQRLFPRQADGLARLFELRREMFTQFAALPQHVGPGGLDAAMAAAPLVFRYRLSTLTEVLDEFLDDPQCAAAIGSIWPYIGSPPSRMSFPLFNQMLETLHHGTFYPRGGFGTLVDALAAAVRDNGGELLLGDEVRRILVEDGRAVGVETAGGTVLHARAVVSNADARQTFGELVGWDLLPTALRRRVDRYRLAPSAFVLYGVLHADPAELGLAHENFVFGSWDHDAIWADVQAARPGGIWVTVPTLADPELAPGGGHLGVVTSLVRAGADGSWRAIRDAHADALLSTVEAGVPGWRDAFEIVDMATPDTLFRYSRSAGGTAYGWENTPAQTASKRLPHRTSLPGLYLSGQWAEEGTSSLRTLTSGRATAAMVAADLEHPTAIPDFGGPSFVNELLTGARQ